MNKIFTQLCLILLLGQVDYNCQEQFINFLPHDCSISTWDMWWVCHQPDVKLRKRLWNRIKDELPAHTNQYKKLIKEIEDLSRETGYKI